jgi:hypothetical protein
MVPLSRYTHLHGLLWTAAEIRQEKDSYAIGKRRGSPSRERQNHDARLAKHLCMVKIAHIVMFGGPMVNLRAFDPELLSFQRRTQPLTTH